MASTPALRLLITGGAGFVGTRILHALLDAHPTWTVIVADITKTYTPPRENVSFVHLDVLSASSCEEALTVSKPDIVIHAAGVVPGGLVRYGTAATARVQALNVGGTQHMLDAARAVGIRFFVFTSSCTTITDDLDHDYPNYNEATPYPTRSLIYGASKAEAERLVLAANSPPDFHTIALRPSVILGEADYQLVPAIAACIPKGETPFVIGSGDNLYDFTYVDNVAHAHLLGVRNLLHFHHPAFSQLPSGSGSAAGLAVNISNDAVITFRDFCLAIWAEYGHVPPYTLVVPKRLAYVAGAFAELWGWFVGGRTTLCRGSVKDAVGTRYADLTRAKTLLGFRPVVDLQEGIRRSVAALKKLEKVPGEAGLLNRAKGFDVKELG